MGVLIYPGSKPENVTNIRVEGEVLRKEGDTCLVGVGRRRSRS